MSALTHLYVLDYEKGRVFRYALHPNMDAESAWDALCEKGEHSDEDCYWMASTESSIVANDFP